MENSLPALVGEDRKKDKRSSGTGSVNWAIARGNRLEPKARARYELLEDIEAPPVTLEHPEYPHYRVSLDGWNADAGVVLEIKCPGREDHGKAQRGEVPEKYIWQLEMQLWVSGGSVAHYFSYYEEKNGKVDWQLIKYHSVPERRERLIGELHQFWDCVTRDVPPPLTDRDSMVVEGDRERAVFAKLAGLERILVAHNEAIEELEREKEALVKEASEFCPHARVTCEGVELIRKKRRSGEEYFQVKLVS